jgi:hypothetical protein
VISIECIRCEHFEACPSAEEKNLPCPGAGKMRRLRRNVRVSNESRFSRIKKEARMKFLVIEENFPDYKIKCPRCCRSFWVGFSDPTKNANIIEKNGEWMPWCP